jgi:hypothetical protein
MAIQSLNKRFLRGSGAITPNTSGKEKDLNMAE